MEQSTVRRIFVSVSFAAIVIGGAIGAFITHVLDRHKGSDTPTSSNSALPIASTPERAISNYLSTQGHIYAGTCANTVVPPDIGKYCSILRQTTEVTRNYLVGPVASEGDIFVLARGDKGWQIAYISITKALVP